MSEEHSAGPSKVPWPPILAVLAILFGYAMQRVAPLPPPPLPNWVGAVFVFAGLAVDFWVFWLFSRHQTNVMPTRPAKSLVTSGPFRWSRNPIYVANVMIILGFLLIGQSWWFLIGASLFVVLVTELQIKREEKHLAETFGEEWQVFAARTRRWI